MPYLRWMVNWTLPTAGCKKMIGVVKDGKILS